MVIFSSVNGRVVMMQEGSLPVTNWSAQTRTTPTRDPWLQVLNHGFLGSLGVNWRLKFHWSIFLILRAGKSAMFCCDKWLSWWIFLSWLPRRYTPPKQTWNLKMDLGKGDSYWKPSFPGSMLNFGCVAFSFSVMISLPGHNLGSPPMRPIQLEFPTRSLQLWNMQPKKGWMNQSSSWNRHFPSIFFWVDQNLSASPSRCRGGGALQLQVPFQHWKRARPRSRYWDSFDGSGRFTSRSESSSLGFNQQAKTHNQKQN